MKRLAMFSVLFCASLAAAQVATFGAITFDASIDDPTAAVEPLTKQELAELEAAKKLVDNARNEQAAVMLRIRRAHGDTSPDFYSHAIQNGCFQPAYTQADIHNKLILIVTRPSYSCMSLN